MPDSHDVNYKVLVEEQDKLGLGQGVQVFKDSVYKVAEAGPRGLVTTSGRMGVTTLDEVSNMIIADMGGRLLDWVITLNGVVQRIVHPDDSITDTLG